MSSLASHYAPLRRFLKKKNAVEVSVPLGMHGAVSEKRVTIYTDAPFLRELGVQVDPRRRLLLRRLRSMNMIQLVRKYRDKRGHLRVATGLNSFQPCS